MHLHHITIRSADMDGMRDFFIDVVGLKLDDRPGAINFPGYWLCPPDGSESNVHLMGAREDMGEGAGEDTQQMSTSGTGAIDHFAFRGDDKAGLVARLEKAGIAYREREVAGGFAQVFFTGPEDITIEVNFPL